MSNVLRKSAFGFMVVAAAVVLFAVLATTALAYTHTVTLKQGSSGSQVMALQQALGITADGAFGPMTKAAVMSYQASHGLTADGVVGAMTGASLAGSGSTSGSTGGSSGALCPNGKTLASNCTESAGSSSSSMGGDDGDITEVDEVSTDDSSIEEGETNEVFGFEFEVEGDVSVDRVDFYMEVSDSTTASDNPDDYFQSAILMVDGEEVATLDVDDWDQDDYAVVANGTTNDDEYRLRFSSLDWVLEDGDNPEVVLAFEVNDSIDSEDLDNADWVVDLETDSIRFVDGRGFSSEEGAALTETFGTDEEETAELKVKTSSEDPEATIIEVSDQDTTEDVTIFVFEIQEENGVDATINDLTVTLTALTSAGAGVDESTVVRDAYLYMGSTQLGSESVATGGVVQFEDIDLAVDGDDTVELTVKVTLADADDFAAGNTLSASITASSDIDDAEDANGNDEGDMTLSGSATGEAHSLREEGIMVTFDDSSYVKTTSDTSGVNETVEFTLEFDITAFGNDAFIAKQSTGCTDNAAPASTYTTDVVVSLDGDTNGDNTTCTEFDSTGDEGTNGFEVEEGQTEHFTVTVLGNAGEAGSAGTSVTFRARLESLGYKMGSDAAGDTQYTFDLADYKSAAVSVFDR